MTMRRFVRADVGSTRVVFLVGRWALKVPRWHYGWRPFLRGLIGNCTERAWWRDTRSPHLCPVVAMLPGGFLLIMRRARPLADAEWETLDLCTSMAQLPVEVKRDSFGMLGGRVVAVDYGDC